MFGKRSGTESDTRSLKPATGGLEPASSTAPAVARAAQAPSVSSPPISPGRSPPPPVVDARRSDSYYLVKATIFGALIEAIDLTQLA